MEKDQRSLAELFLENIVRTNPPVFRYLDIKDHPMFGWAVETRLLSETENARNIPCYDCEEGCPREIRYFDDDPGGVRIRAICPEDRMVSGKDLVEDDVRRYKIGLKPFYKHLCEMNGVAFDPGNLDDAVAYLGTRDFDGQSLLFYIAARVNNKTSENELMKIATQKPDVKKCIILPPRIKIPPALETNLNAAKLYLFYVKGNITDGKFRFQHYALGMTLKIKGFSFDELTTDGYLLILNPSNSDGCFLGSKIFPTRTQFQILLSLAENSSKGVPKNDLFDFIYDLDGVEDVDKLSDSQNPLDSHLARLRKLLDANNPKGSAVPRGTKLINTSKKHGTVILNLPHDKVSILHA